MADIVIAAAARSAVGRSLKGSLALTRPDDLAGQVVRAVLARVPNLNPKEVDDLILGCAMPKGSRGSTSPASSGSSAASPSRARR